MGALSATRENILDHLHLDPVRSGASAARSASVRLGFLPLALEHLSLDAMAGIPIYLRTAISRDSRPDSQFTLYCAPHVRMTEYHRQRLREAGVRFIKG